MKRIADFAHAALALRDLARTAWLETSRQRPLAAPKQALPQESLLAPDLAQLIGRRHRLQQELAMACDAYPLKQARIYRLLEDLASTQCDIAALRAVREEDDQFLGGSAARQADE